MNSSLDPSPSPRKATLKDLESLVELENEIFSYDRLSKKSFRHFLLSNNELYVLEISNKLAGYILILNRSGSLKKRIYSLAVSSHFQGMGLGKILMKKAIEASKDQKAKSLRLEVKVSNAGAIALYEKLGFIKNSIIPEFYSDGESAVVYILTI